MIRTGLAEMFPKSSEYLGIELVLPGGSYIEGTVVVKALRLCNSALLVLSSHVDYVLTT
jgi:hypothetical protein